MRFSYDGMEFDTEAMLCPQLNDRSFMRVFISSDFRHVFGAYFNEARELEVTKIDGRLLFALAVRTGCAELRRAVEAAGALEESMGARK